MRYAFFGTPEFAALILQKLIGAGLPPTAVVCNPDRPAGRKKILTPPETKIVAQRHNISVLQPEKLDEIKTELDYIKEHMVNVDIVLTDEDIESLDEAEKDLKSGRTKRL